MSKRTYIIHLLLWTTLAAVAAANHLWLAAIPMSVLALLFAWLLTVTHATGVLLPRLLTAHAEMCQDGFDEAARVLSSIPSWILRVRTVAAAVSLARAEVALRHGKFTDAERYSTTAFQSAPSSAPDTVASARAIRALSCAARGLDEQAHIDILALRPQAPTTVPGSRARLALAVLNARGLSGEAEAEGIRATIPHVRRNLSKREWALGEALVRNRRDERQRFCGTVDDNVRAWVDSVVPGLDEWIPALTSFGQSDPLKQKVPRARKGPAHRRATRVGAPVLIVLGMVGLTIVNFCSTRGETTTTVVPGPAAPGLEVLAPLVAWIVLGIALIAGALMMRKLRKLRRVRRELDGLEAFSALAANPPTGLAPSDYLRLAHRAERKVELDAALRFCDMAITAVGAERVPDGSESLLDNVYARRAFLLAVMGRHRAANKALGKLKEVALNPQLVSFTQLVVAVAHDLEDADAEAAAHRATSYVPIGSAEFSRILLLEALQAATLPGQAPERAWVQEVVDADPDLRAWMDRVGSEVLDAVERGEQISAATTRSGGATY